MKEPVLVAGAGIAGLAAALALSRHGLDVRVLERAEWLDEAGAGLQLSPNASRILFGLGLGDALLAASVRPEAVVLKDARTLRPLARVRLGSWAERRWGAPYLTLHRADLQRVLLDAASARPKIRIQLGTGVSGVTGHRAGVAATMSRGEAAGCFLVGADGVGSAVRVATREAAAERRVGLTAWRVTMTAEALKERALLGAVVEPDCVTALLHPRVHLVGYPLRAGFNLVAFSPTRGAAGSEEDARSLAEGFANAHPELAGLAADSAAWSAWPIRTVTGGAWTDGERLALIGDAAHAMPPFAAQGAAMAIEDAVTLAPVLAKGDGAAALRAWEGRREARVARVRKRGSLNRLAWHAAGPARLVRDALLRLRSPERLAADLDWLYGFDAESAG